jgi:hypothetical protein
MADIDFDSFGSAGMAGAGPAIRTLANWAGGALSLALVAGLGIWGYKIMVRDVSGVPVVRALEGPIRVAPDDPGGRQAAHQGLAVNRVAAEGEAAPPADTLRLAPQPVALTADDLPEAELRPAPAAELTALPEADAEAAPEAVEAVEAALGPDDGAGSVLAASGDETGFGAEALLAERDGALDAAEGALALPPGALRHSPRPAARPDDMDLAAQAAIAAATAALAPHGPSDLAPEDVIAGTALVQLGAFDESGEARAAWDALSDQARFTGFFDDKARVVQEATGGGRTFYRLRAAGFDDIADARRFCAALTAEGADCIPVVAR